MRNKILNMATTLGVITDEIRALVTWLRQVETNAYQHAILKYFFQNGLRSVRWINGMRKSYGGGSPEAEHYPLPPPAPSDHKSGQLEDTLRDATKQVNLD